ncbi:MAG: hypothetical protein JNM39_12195 [Bdellovibrionaceae bacterium]|nr:hypothetical protein [Pseudobdellovibrionaceae bacterium]
MSGALRNAAERTQKKGLKRFLLTGFEPFGEFKVNPSAELMTYLGNRGYQTVVLPVSYALIDQKLAALKLVDFDFIVLFGLASGRDCTSLERVALNWIEGELADNLGLAPLPQMIDQSQPEAIINKLPFHQWLKEYADLGLNLKISHSAGTYLCNYLYFQVLKINKNCVFIHLPQESDFEKLSQMIEGLLTSPKGQNCN